MPGNRHTTVREKESYLRLHLKPFPPAQADVRRKRMRSVRAHERDDPRAAREECIDEMAPDQSVCPATATVRGNMACGRPVQGRLQRTS